MVMMYIAVSSLRFFRLCITYFTALRCIPSVLVLPCFLKICLNVRSIDRSL